MTRLQHNSATSIRVDRRRPSAGVALLLTLFVRSIVTVWVVNMLESAIAFIPDPLANHTQLGIPNDPLTRVATSHSFAFRCADGKLLGVHLSSQTKFWEGLLIALNRPDLADEPPQDLTQAA